MERIKRVGKVDGGSFEIFGNKKYNTVAKLGGGGKEKGLL